MKNAALCLIAAGLLAACASTKPTENAAPVVNATPPATSGSGSNVQTSRADNTNAARLDPLSDPNGGLSKRSVYFDFDKYDVRSDEEALVSAHGRYLAAHADRSIRVEGNADERGSREYNLALGQKRAEAVRKAMEAVGAKDNQIEATSNGKEKPRAEGHDEASWSENRRDDLIYANR